MARGYFVIDYTGGVPDLPKNTANIVVSTAWVACTPGPNPTVLAMIVASAGVIIVMKASSRFLWLADTITFGITEGNLGVTEAADAKTWLQGHGWIGSPVLLNIIGNASTRRELVRRIAALHNNAWDENKVEENRLG